MLDTQVSLLTAWLTWQLIMAILSSSCLANQLGNSYELSYV